MIDCGAVIPFYSRQYLKADLVRGFCLCNLDYLQRALVEKPLHDETHAWRVHPKHLDMYMAKSRIPGYSNQYSGFYSPNPVRVSSIVNRMLESALVSSKQLKPTRREVRAYVDGPIPLFKERIAQKIDEKLERPKFVEFDTTLDQFDMGSFRKIGPIFAICVFVNLLVWSCELVMKYFAEVIAKLSGRRLLLANRFRGVFDDFMKTQRVQIGPLSHRASTLIFSQAEEPFPTQMEVHPRVGDFNKPSN